jgi:putative FmdB family regulatory protein
MPTYEYRCRKGHQFEVFHSIRDDSPRRCPRCGSRAQRVPAGGAGLLFKGSGFYVTDYRSSSYQAGAREDKPAAKSAEAPSGSAGDAAGGAAKPPKTNPRAKKRKSAE